MRPCESRTRSQICRMTTSKQMGEPRTLCAHQASLRSKGAGIDEPHVHPCRAVLGSHVCARPFESPSHRVLAFLLAFVRSFPASLSADVVCQQPVRAHRTLLAPCFAEVATILTRLLVLPGSQGRCAVPPHIWPRAGSVAETNCRPGGAHQQPYLALYRKSASIRSAPALCKLPVQQVGLATGLRVSSSAFTLTAPIAGR